jgi:hypothetical protein
LIVASISIALMLLGKLATNAPRPATTVSPALPSPAIGQARPADCNVFWTMDRRGMSDAHASPKHEMSAQGS